MADLFKVGATLALNYTNHILVPTYKVNRFPVYYEWTDANHTLHKEIIRWKVQGSFTMKFDDPDEFDTFLLITSTSGINTDGTVHASLYANNAVKEFEGDYFISYDPSNIKPLMGVSSYDGFEVTIEEK